MALENVPGLRAATLTMLFLCISGVVFLLVRFSWG